VQQGADPLAGVFAGDPVMNWLIGSNADVRARLHLMFKLFAWRLPQTLRLISMIQAAHPESSNPVNDPLYHRFGFESRCHIPLPRGAPPITVMWRDPR